MLHLEKRIEQIKHLLTDNHPSSLTYAALEARLAIEEICYQRLRFLHDYISDSDLKKWQPAAVVKTLISEVDSDIAKDLRLEMCPTPKNEVLSEDEFKELSYELVGIQVGFNTKEIGELWNGLANTALHLHVPKSSASVIPHYGEPDPIRKKVTEALEVIEKVSQGNLITSGFGPAFTFTCACCGAENKRKSIAVSDGKVFHCIREKCQEPHICRKDEQGNLQVYWDCFIVSCAKCGKKTKQSKRKARNLRGDATMDCSCDCGQPITVRLGPVQSQPDPSKSPPPSRERVAALPAPPKAASLNPSPSSPASGQGPN